MPDINEPILPAIPEAAIELLPCPFCGGESAVTISDSDNLYRVECLQCSVDAAGENKGEAIATWNRRATPLVPAPIQGDVAEEEVHDPVAYRYRWGGDEAWTLSHDCPRFASETLEVQPLFATRRAHPSVEPARVELEREAAQWQAAAGQSLVRAEALEDRLETVERERDEARDRARILGDKYNQWFERAEAAETRAAELERQIEELRGWDEVWRGRVDAAETDAAELQREHAHLLNETGCGNFNGVIDALAKLTRERDEARSECLLQQNAADFHDERAEALEAELARLQSAQPAGDRPDSGEAGRTLLNQEQSNDD